jgi:deazaflavin-dependent oxidoreductase (nitroreductase family)
MTSPNVGGTNIEGGPVANDDAAKATNDWNQTIIDEFRANGGHVGGVFEGAPMLLLHTTGAKSGAKRVNPMMYLEQDGHIYVFASKAGHHAHPHWYRNLIAHPKVTYELGNETFSARAVDVTGDERRRIYDVQAELRPNFAEYEQKTTRVIPVVELVRD